MGFKTKGDVDPGWVGYLEEKPRVRLGGLLSTPREFRFSEGRVVGQEHGAGVFIHPGPF